MGKSQLMLDKKASPKIVSLVFDILSCCYWLSLFVREASSESLKDFIIWKYS